MVEEAEADERTAEIEEGLVEVVAALVADGEAAEVVQPGEGAFDDPAVAAEAGGALDALAGDADLDAAPVEVAAAVRVVVALVGVQLGGPLATVPVRLPDAWDRLDQRGEDGVVGAVGARDAAGEREALALDDEVVLGAGFGAVGRVRAGRLAPPLARTLALSTLARDQSMRPAAPSRSSSTRCSAAQTPAACQSRKRRQQVTPLPQPSSCGSIRHWMPVMST